MSQGVLECPLCSGRKFRPILEARDFHYGNQGTFPLDRCTDCGLCFQNPMWTDAELSGFYPKTYYAYTDRTKAHKLPFVKRILKPILGLRELTTKDPYYDRPGKMLDVGCGSGWFIKRMRDKGWEVKGVEPSSAAAELGRKEFGLDIFNGTLCDAQFGANSFDYIRLNHSFEHMNDPNTVLKEIHRILAPNGKLMIGVPNGSSLNARLFGQYWYHLALPVHTFIYSPQTLTRMLEKHGFSVIKIEHNADNTGIQGSLQFFLNRREDPIKPEGRVTRSQVARIVSTWLTGIENICRVADLIEVTAAKGRP